MNQQEQDRLKALQAKQDKTPQEQEEQKRLEESSK